MCGRFRVLLQKVELIEKRSVIKMNYALNALVGTELRQYRKSEIILMQRNSNGKLFRTIKSKLLANSIGNNAQSQFKYFFFRNRTLIMVLF